MVFVPSGPFQGICGVVREVDHGREELHLDIPVRGGRHNALVRFDEVELDLAPDP